MHTFDSSTKPEKERFASVECLVKKKKKERRKHFQDFNFKPVRKNKKKKKNGGKIVEIELYPSLSILIHSSVQHFQCPRDFSFFFFCYWKCAVSNSRTLPVYEEPKHIYTVLKSKTTFTSAICKRNRWHGSKSSAQ